MYNLKHKKVNALVPSTQEYCMYLRSFLCVPHYCILPLSMSEVATILNFNQSLILFIVQPSMYLLLKCLNLPYFKFNIIETYHMYSSMTCLFGSNCIFEISLGLWFVPFFFLFFFLFFLFFVTPVAY